MIAYHQKGRHGWAHIVSRPVNDPAWSEADREWIDELMRHGQRVITVGHSMWEFKPTDHLQADEAAAFSLMPTPNQPKTTGAQPPLF